MNVGELIDYLGEYPRDFEVLATHPDGVTVFIDNLYVSFSTKTVALSEHIQEKEE